MSDYDVRDNRSINPGPSTSVPGSTIPISIVSNSLLLERALVVLLDAHIMVELIATHSALPIPPSHSPNPEGHVVLLDSAIGFNVLQEWTRYWRSLVPPASVVVLEMEDNVVAILACIEAGISGYTLRGAAPQEVAEAIHLARHGEARCSPQVTAQLFARLATIKAMNIKQTGANILLTPRELQVLDLIAKGYSNKEIALALSITLRTVKYHVHRVLHKLELKDRREAAALALNWNWMEHTLPTTRKFTND